MKSFDDFGVDDVCMFLVGIGLGNAVDAIKENAVDGKLLASLSEDDMKSDLGLSGLQSKKLLQQIQEYQEMSAGGGGASDEELAKLMQENETLKAEVAQLKAELAKLQPPAPAPAPPPPAPAPAPSKPKPAGAPVIRGAAGGAARGAVLGAVGGAIAGDAAKGAKMGAAMGATAGGMRGLGARRRARMMR